MFAVRVIVTLQRPATPDEIAGYGYYERLFDELGTDHPDVRHVRDLIPEDDPLYNLVRLGKGRQGMMNTVVEAATRIPLGMEGSKRAVLSVAGKLIRGNVTDEHEWYYITIELAGSDGTSRGHRTVAPRQEIPMALRRL